MKSIFLKGVILGATMGAGFSLLDKRSDKIVTNTIIGAIVGAVLLNILNKKIK
jgi:hypothetical protein